MIHIEIIQAPDSDAINSYRFFQNQLYIGRSRGNLCINDPGLRESHVILEVIQADLIIHPQKEVAYYLLNGKRATEIRKLKIQDTVTVGSTTFKIRAYEETTFPSKKEILTAKMNQLIEGNSSRLETVEKLISLSK